jgi:hypothetical protein
MNRILQCERCLYNTRNPHLLCTLHPMGVESDTCPDFEPDPNAEPEELWEPEGAAYYNGELIYQPTQRWTKQQQLELLLWHPAFTGKCPQCSVDCRLGKGEPVHWDCDRCGWKDDSV